MKDTTLLATDYLTDYFEGHSSGSSVVIDTLKIALILYHRVDIDRSSEYVERLIQHISYQIDSRKAKNDIRSNIHSISHRNVKFNLEPGFETSIAVGAAYEVLCEREPDWYLHWQTGILRAQNLAQMVVLYELYCNDFDCEFYTSMEHRKVVNNVFYKMMTSFSRGGPAENLIKNIKKSDYSEGIFHPLEDMLHRLSDTLEKNLMTSDTDLQRHQKPEDMVLYNLYLPNPGELTWNDIATLRQSKFRQYFLEHQFKDMDTSSAEEATEYLIEHIYELLGKKRPNVVPNILQRVVSNLPIPAIGFNPFSLVGLVKDSVEEAQEVKNYGWIYFLAEANLLARSDLDKDE